MSHSVLYCTMNSPMIPRASWALAFFTPRSKMTTHPRNWTSMRGTRSRPRTGSLWATLSGSPWATLDTVPVSLTPRGTA